MKAVRGEQITKESKLEEDPNAQTSSTLKIKENVKIEEEGGCTLNQENYENKLF